MSAPRRRRTHGVAAPVTRSRRDITIAVAGSAVVVFGTLFLIWALRPGNFNPGSGGIMHRQPRVSWWVVLTLFGLGIAVWAVRRPTAKFRSPRKVLTACVASVLVVSLVVFAVWQAQGGILRHYTPAATFTVPSTSAPTGSRPTISVPAPSVPAPSTPGAPTSVPAPTAASTVPPTAAP